MDRWVSASGLAACVGVAKRSVVRRATRENWRYRIVKTNGGDQRRYHLSTLPDDIQIAWAKRHGASTPAESKTVDVPADQSGPLMERIPEKHRRIAYARAALLVEYDTSALNVEDFVAAYNAGHVGTDARETVGDISVPTMYRYIKVRKERGIEGLAPKWATTGSSHGRTLMSDADKALAASLWLTPNKLSMKKVARTLEYAYGVHVNYYTLRRYLQSLPEALVSYMREGATKYRNRFEPYIEGDPTLYESMEWVVGDHHMFDVAVTDGERVFRPWITIFTDRRSRMPVGWDVNDGPDSLTILKTLDMAVREYGAPQNILIDNGKDYRAQLLNGRNEWITVETNGISTRSQVTIKGIFAELECSVHFSTRYRPQSKGDVERSFGTYAADFCKEFDTYVGSNTTERPEVAQLYYRRLANLEKKEVLLHIDEFRERFEAYLKWWVENWKHSGKGMDGQTPKAVFHENWKTRRVVPERYRMLLFVRTETRKVTRNGVTIDDIKYYTPDMLEWKGQHVMVRRGFDDLSRVWIHDLDGRYLCEAHADQLRATGVTERDLKRVRAQRQAENRTLKKMVDPIKALQKDRRGIVEVALEQREHEITYETPEQQVVVVGGGIELPPEPGKPVPKDSEKIIPFSSGKRRLKGVLDVDSTPLKSGE